MPISNFDVTKPEDLGYMHTLLSKTKEVNPKKSEVEK
jgi:hypothetical protein